MKTSRSQSGLLSSLPVPPALQGRIATAAFFLVAPLLFLVPVSSPASDDSQTSLPAAVACKRELEIRRAESGYAGPGRVVAGRLELPQNIPSADVVSRTELFGDGSFAGFVRRGNSLSFRVHGYQPLDLQAPNGDRSVIHEAGTVHLQPVPPEQQSRVSGTVRLPLVLKGTRADVLLKVMPPPPMWDDYGHECAAVYSHVAAIRKVRSGEPFEFTGLSPMDYEIEIVAPGSVRLTRSLTPSPGTTTDLGVLPMERARYVRFRYISQATTRDALLQARPQTRTILADGRNEFLFTSEKDELGNELDLQLTPSDDGLRAEFWYSPRSFHDLGPISLEQAVRRFPRTKGHEPPGIFRPYLFLRHGHVYFFESKDKNAACLFRVEFDPADSPGPKTSRLPKAPGRRPASPRPKRSPSTPPAPAPCPPPAGPAWCCPVPLPLPCIPVPPCP